MAGTIVRILTASEARKAIARATVVCVAVHLGDDKFASVKVTKREAKAMLVGLEPAAPVQWTEDRAGWVTIGKAAL